MRDGTPCQLDEPSVKRDPVGTNCAVSINPLFSRWEKVSSMHITTAGHYLLRERCAIAHGKEGFLKNSRRHIAPQRASEEGLLRLWPRLCGDWPIVPSYVCNGPGLRW